MGSWQGQQEEEQTPGKPWRCYHSSFLPSAGHILIFTPGLSNKPGASPTLQVSLLWFLDFNPRLSQGQLGWGRGINSAEEVEKVLVLVGISAPWQAPLRTHHPREKAHSSVLWRLLLPSLGAGESPVFCHCSATPVQRQEGSPGMCWFGHSSWQGAPSMNLSQQAALTVTYPLLTLSRKSPVAPA